MPKQVITCPKCGARIVTAEVKKLAAEVRKLQARLAAREKTIEAEIERKVARALRKGQNETAARLEPKHRIQAGLIKPSSRAKHDKLEMLYQYLSSAEFRHRIEGMVETFRLKHDDLEKERQIMERQWAKRAKQGEMILQNISGMYGDMQAITGQALPKIRRLELPTVNEA